MAMITTKAGRQIVQVCCTIDLDLRLAAKEKNINVSALLARALKAELGTVTT